MTTATTYRWKLTFGEDVDYLPDEFYMAQEWMHRTIKELGELGNLPGWRTVALLEQCQHMPRAGFSFYLDRVGMVKCERVRGDA